MEPVKKEINFRNWASSPDRPTMPDSVILAITRGWWMASLRVLKKGGTRPILLKVACHRRGIQLSWLPTKTLPSSSEQHTLHMLLLMTLLRQYRELFLIYSLARRRGVLEALSRDYPWKNISTKTPLVQCRTK